MKRLRSKPKDKRSCYCPQCSKQRMTRDVDHVVSNEKKTYKVKDGSEVEFFIDICDWCQSRNFSKYFQPSNEDVRKVLKAMQEDAKLDEGESLEDLL